MGARHGDSAANHNSTHFLVWSTGPLFIVFGRPDRKLFLTGVPILPCSGPKLNKPIMITNGKRLQDIKKMDWPEIF